MNSNLRSASSLKNNSFIKPIESGNYFNKGRFDENLTPIAQEFPFNMVKDMKTMQSSFSPGKTSEIKSKIMGGDMTHNLDIKSSTVNSRETKTLATKEYRSAFLKKFSARQSEKPFLRNINNNGECMDHVVRANLFEDDLGSGDFPHKPYALDRNLLYEQEEANRDEMKLASRSRSQEKFSYQGRSSINSTNGAVSVQSEDPSKVNEYRKNPIVKRSPSAKEKEFSLPNGSSITEQASLKVNTRIQEFLSDRESRIFLSNSEICNKMAGGVNQGDNQEIAITNKVYSSKEDIEEISSLLLSRVRGDSEGRNLSPRLIDKCENREALNNITQPACNLPMTEQGTLQYLFDEIAMLKKSEDCLKKDLEVKTSENEDLNRKLKEAETRITHIGKEKEIAELKMKKYERDLQEYILKLKEAKKEILNSKMFSNNIEQLDSRMKVLVEENESLKKKNSDFETLLKNVLFERELKKKGQNPTQLAPIVQENVKPIVPPLFTAAFLGTSTQQPQKAAEPIKRKAAEPCSNDISYKYYKPVGIDEKENIKDMRVSKASLKKEELISSPNGSKQNKGSGVIAQKRSSSANNSRGRGNILNNTIALDKIYKGEDGLEGFNYSQTTKNVSTVDKGNKSEFLKINDVLNRSMPRPYQLSHTEEDETENHQIKNIIGLPKLL